MSVTQTTEAGRAVAVGALARRQAEAAARRAAAKLNGDDGKPLFVEGEPTIGKAPLEDLPEPPAAPAAEPAKAARTIALRTTVQYRDYLITITATGMTLDSFCDMLDKRLGATS
jgi:hypothetical protein